VALRGLRDGGSIGIGACDLTTVTILRLLRTARIRRSDARRCVLLIARLLSLLGVLVQRLIQLLAAAEHRAPRIAVAAGDAPGVGVGRDAGALELFAPLPLIDLGARALFLGREPGDPALAHRDHARRGRGGKQLRGRNRANSRRPAGGLGTPGQQLTVRVGLACSGSQRHEAGGGRRRFGLEVFGEEHRSGHCPAA
jgi:hypothetical protein